MMHIWKALGIKIIGIGIFAFGIYGIFQYATIGRLLLMTIIVVVLTFLGDLYVLPRINQVAAVVADFAAIFLLYLILGNLVIGGTTTIILPAFAAALFSAAGEAVFHIYMMDRIHGGVEESLPLGDVLTEMGEETDPDEFREKKHGDSD